jgi:signal transduction histidine kinase
MLVLKQLQEISIKWKIVSVTSILILLTGVLTYFVFHTVSTTFSVQLIVLFIVVFILMFSGYMLIATLLKPLEQITITLDEINANNLSTRIEIQNESTDVIQLVTSINTMIQRIENSFKQIQQFTSDASHELRTPLAILMGELEIGLHTSKSKQDFQEVILSALDEVIRLSKVVSSLLELSKAESGKLILQFEETNLSELLLDLIEDAEILSEAKKITLHHSVEQDIYVEVDSSKMHQALLNIIENSIKYTQEQGEVSINLCTSDFFVIIEVKDNGIGMSEEELPFIFDRFYRADISRSQVIHGTGIGLAIVKWILEGHETITTVQSKPNEGTTFLIKLPKQRKAQ